MKNNYQAALDVWMGKYGSGTQRSAALKKAGYDPDEIQDLVNTFSPEDLAELAKGIPSVSVQPAAEDRVLDVELDLQKYDALRVNFKV